MAEIKYPEKRTFWKVSISGKTHEGFTDIDQVTTAPTSATMTSNIMATSLFPALPTSGTLTEGAIYAYNGGMVSKCCAGFMAVTIKINGINSTK